MTESLPTIHRQFARVVRRRLIAIRTFEIVGTAVAWLAISLAVAIAFDSTVAARVAVAVVAIITAIRFSRPQPTLIAVATLVDATHDWDDLLSSAVATGNASDPFAAAVQASADARCRAVHPSSVPVARRGQPGWWTIAITVSFSMLVLLAHRQRPPHGDALASQATVVATLDEDPPPLPTLSTAAPAGPPRRTGVDEMHARSTTPDIADASPTANDAQGPHQANQRSANAGVGRGVSTAPPGAMPVDDAPSGSAHSTVAVGSQLAGGGETATPAGGDHDVAMGFTAAPAGTTAVPPSQSSNWRDARSAATAAINAGTVPARDRELVRAYFDRAADPR